MGQSLKQTSHQGNTYKANRYMERCFTWNVETAEKLLIAGG